MTNNFFLFEYIWVGGFMDYEFIFSDTNETLQNILCKIYASFIENELTLINCDKQNE